MDYTVSAVDEAIGLLLLVAANPGLGVTEIARRSGNTKGRAFRLLVTLEQRHMVRRQGDGAAYFLGYQSLHLGTAARDQIDLVRLVEQPLQELGAIFNETVAVRVREELEAICIGRWESTRSLRVHGALRRPLHAGASSKVLLAHAPAAVVAAVLDGVRPQLGAGKQPDRDALVQELQRIREQGYARSVAERTADTAGIAVPIWDASRSVVAVLGISVPRSRMSEARFAVYLRQLQLQAAGISNVLGYPGG